MKEKKEKNAKNEAVKWFITIFIVTFLLSMLFSYISTTAMDKLSLIPAILILVSVILTGILFDLVGVAVTCATEEEFHAMASKKAINYQRFRISPKRMYKCQRKKYLFCLRNGALP